MKSLHRKRKNAGIFFRVLRGYTLIVVLVLSFTCFVSIQIAKHYVLSQYKQELMDKALMVRPSKSSAPDWSLIRKYQYIADLEIVFIDSDYFAAGVRSRSSRAEETETVQPTYVEVVSGMDRRIIDRIFEGKNVTGVEKVDFLTRDVMYAGVPVYDANHSVMAAMMLFRPIDNVDDVWKPVVFFFCLACIVGVILITVFSWLFSKSLTTPLKIMNSAANKMAEGDYSKRIETARMDEIGTLAETLNLLSSRLQKMIESLQNEKSKLEMVLMNIGDGIVACDSEYRLLHLNQAALGYLEIGNWEKDENEGKRRLMDLARISMNSGDIETQTWKTPSKRDISFVATPILNAERVSIGAVCLLRDVSEEMRLEQRRKEYIGNVSHELRTPLTGIRGMIEPLMDGVLETEEEKQDHYRVIYRETGRLEKLISDMLELSRLQEGRVSIANERFSLVRAVENGLSSMRPLAEKAGISLRTDYETEIYPVGDADKISELIVILVDNAICFTPEGGTIEVSIKKECGKAVVSVSDTGAGIEPRDLPHIWERFYKADKSRLRTTGTGLGLAIAKHIVQLMNGAITAESEIGKGSTFRFKINIE